MLKHLIPCLKYGLEDMKANLDLMKFDLEGMVPVWDDIPGQTAAIRRLQDDVAEMEQVIHALDKGYCAYLIYRAGRVLRRFRHWASTQSLVMRIHSRIWKLRFRIWASNIRIAILQLRKGKLKLRRGIVRFRIGAMNFRLWDGDRNEKLQ